MINFQDRIPLNPNRYKMTDSDDVESYVVLERADNATVTGTVLNREAFMAIQGFIASETSISKSNGITTIQEINSKGDTLNTTISKSDNITTITSVFTSGLQTITSITTISKIDGVTTIETELS